MAMLTFGMPVEAGKAYVAPLIPQLAHIIEANLHAVKAVMVPRGLVDALANMPRFVRLLSLSGVDVILAIDDYEYALRNPMLSQLRLIPHAESSDQVPEVLKHGSASLFAYSTLNIGEVELGKAYIHLHRPILRRGFNPIYGLPPMRVREAYVVLH